MSSSAMVLNKIYPLNRDFTIATAPAQAHPCSATPPLTYTLLPGLLRPLQGALFGLLMLPLFRQRLVEHLAQDGVTFSNQEHCLELVVEHGGLVHDVLAGFESTDLPPRRNTIHTRSHYRQQKKMADWGGGGLATTHLFECGNELTVLLKVLGGQLERAQFIQG